MGICRCKGAGRRAKGERQKTKINVLIQTELAPFRMGLGVKNHRQVTFHRTPELKYIK